MYHNINKVIFNEDRLASQNEGEWHRLVSVDPAFVQVVVIVVEITFSVVEVVIGIVRPAVQLLVHLVSLLFQIGSLKAADLRTLSDTEPELGCVNPMPPAASSKPGDIAIFTQPI